MLPVLKAAEGGAMVGRVWAVVAIVWAGGPGRPPLIWGRGGGCEMGGWPRRLLLDVTYEGRPVLSRIILGSPDEVQKDTSFKWSG